MKKHVLLFFFTTIVSLAAIAQSDSSTRIKPLNTQSPNAFIHKDTRFSLSFTPLVSWIKPETGNITSAGSKIGIAGGLSYEKSLTSGSSRAAYTIGLNVTQMGGVVKYDSLQVSSATRPNPNPIYRNVEYAYSTRYVEVPVTIKLRTDEFGYHRIFFDVGVAPGFLWSGKADLSVTNVFTNAEGGNEGRNVNQNKNDFDPLHSSVNQDNIRIFRVPLLVTAGWEYALSQNTIFFAGLRYSGGLFNVMSADNTEAFNNYIGINIGLLF